MNDLSPPGYSTSDVVDEAVSSSVLLNLTPPAESTTFQLGYLGHGQAFISGEVQVKYAGSEGQGKPSFTKLVVIFRGIERLEAETIELAQQREVLWGEGAAGSSSSSSVSTTSDFPPTNSPFKLRITPDLPVCLHLGTSSLEYSLSAELHSSDPSIPPIVRCAPVHLVRTSPPGSRLSDINLTSLSTGSTAPSISPSIVTAQDPLPFSVKLPRTVFRRGEPVELIARIEVPTAKAVGEGLRLRTVSAELVRIINVNSISSGSTASTADSQSSHRTVLAHSGKSARFSPIRPIFIRLMLHPPAELSCESITQSTILHSVSFAVIVTVGLFSLSQNPSSASTSAISFDAVLSQPIFIVPSTPTSRTDKQKEAERDLDLPDTTTERTTWSFFPPPPLPPADSPGEAIDGPVPSYVEHGADDPGIATVASSSNTRVWTEEEEDEEEYDGYEELSIPMAEPPPAIDDDVSPPSPSEITHRRLPREDLAFTTVSEEEEDHSPSGFASFAADRSHTSIAPLPSVPASPEPSSPPPPLSPLSISYDNYPLPPLAPPDLSDEVPPPTSTNEASPSLFSEYLPPPYIGTAPSTSNASPALHHRERSSSRSRSISSLPPPSPPSEEPPSPPPETFTDVNVSTIIGAGQERRTSETLLRDPPPYQEEANTEGVDARTVTGRDDRSSSREGVSEVGDEPGEYRFGHGRRGELVL